jgi:hypothetical protein
MRSERPAADGIGSGDPEIVAGVRQFQAEGVLPIHAAADGIRRVAVGEPFDGLASPA